MGAISRGCTGSISYEFPDTVSIAGFTWFRVVMEQNGEKIIVRDEDTLVIDTERNTVTVSLSQRDMNKFKGGWFTHQIRFGNLFYALKSQVFSDIVEDVLDDERLPILSDIIEDVPDDEGLLTPR